MLLHPTPAAHRELPMLSLAQPERLQIIDKPLIEVSQEESERPGSREKSVGPAKMKLEDRMHGGSRAGSG